jgi:hypothetical protein
LRARRGWSGAEFWAGKVRAMHGGTRGDLAAIAATRCPSFSCRHSPFVSCVACGVLWGLSRGHVCAVLVRYAGDWVAVKCGVLVVGEDSLADVLGDVQDRRGAPGCGDYGAG